MNGPAFLSPDAARAENGFAPRAASPLARALAGSAGIRDLSLLRKVELRGASADDVPEEAEAIWITPQRVLLVWDDEQGSADIDAGASFALELTGALAGIEIEGETLMRRLTDLDLSRLPAAGKVAGVPAIVGPAAGSRYRIFFAQEVGHSVVETVRDLQEGVA